MRNTVRVQKNRKKKKPKARHFDENFHQWGYEWFSWIFYSITHSICNLYSRFERVPCCRFSQWFINRALFVDELWAKTMRDDRLKMNNLQTIRRKVTGKLQIWLVFIFASVCECTISVRWNTVTSNSWNAYDRCFRKRVYFFRFLLSMCSVSDQIDYNLVDLIVKNFRESIFIGLCVFFWSLRYTFCIEA